MAAWRASAPSEPRARPSCGRVACVRPVRAPSEPRAWPQRPQRLLASLHPPGLGAVAQLYAVSPLQGKEEFEKTQKELLEKGNIMRQGKGQLELQQVRAPTLATSPGAVVLRVRLAS